jgi:hypothetical protein
VQPGDRPATLDINDQAAVERTIRRSLTSGEPYTADHHIVYPDGGIGWLHSVGRVFLGPERRSGIDAPTHLGRHRPPGQACPGLARRRVIDITCTAHGGARKFTPLVCTKVDGDIQLDPHAMGLCVIVLDEKAASELFDALWEWLG